MTIYSFYELDITSHKNHRNKIEYPLKKKYNAIELPHRVNLGGKDLEHCETLHSGATRHGVRSWNGGGMGPQGPGWQVSWRPVVALVIFAFLASNFPSAEAVCDVEHCWNLFQYAQEHLGIRDDYPINTRPSGAPTRQEKEARCIVRRTFFLCLRNMSRSCRSDLSFHSAYRGLENQLKQLECRIEGPVFDISDIPPAPPSEEPAGAVCTYTGQHTHAYCSLYGDPHLRTFTGDYVTCRTEGVWPLIDNDYLTVQVTNRQHGLAYSTATSVSEVTVVIKSDACAERDYLTFTAYSGYLPSTFEDGSYEKGPDGSVFIDELSPNQHVEIYLRYIDTTIVIRQISAQFFSVGMRIPQEIVNETLAHAEVDPDSFLPVQLCIKGCPHNELIDYREILVQSHPVRGRGKHDRQVLNTAVVSRDVALDICQRAGLLDYYLDSCVYDLMSTGDANFTLAVRLAQTDEFRLVPELVKQHLNRTVLNNSDINDYSSPNSDTPHVSGTSGVHLSGYLTLFSILFISHLNYIHRTTFLLICGLLTLSYGAW